MEIQELVLDGPVLAVHAHPDDETLTSGGLLATAVQRGVPVTLVTCTRGEQGEVIGSDPLGLEGNGPALGAFREQELARAMGALGVTDHLFLDEVPSKISDELASSAAGAVAFVDSGMAWLSDGETAGSGPEEIDAGLDAPAKSAGEPVGDSAAAQLPADVPSGAFYFCDLEVAAGLLAAVIENRQPSILATYEPGGGYGHPDHVRTYQVAKRAVAIVAARGRCATPRLLSAVVPAELARQGRAELQQLSHRGVLAGAADGGRVPDADAALPAVSSHSLDSAFSVDCEPVVEKIIAAMREHATQIQWAASYGTEVLGSSGVVCGSYGLSNMIIAPILKCEYYAILGD